MNPLAEEVIDEIIKYDVAHSGLDGLKEKVTILEEGLIMNFEENSRSLPKSLTVDDIHSRLKPDWIQPLMKPGK